MNNHHTGGLSILDCVIPGIYLLWGLGHRAPKSHVWRAPSGMRISSRRADVRVPCARSRAILLFLATRVVESGPTFTGYLTDIASMFQLPWPLANIEDHFLRVIHAEYACSTDACLCYPLPCRGERQVAYRVRYDGDTHQFEVTLSDDFLLSAQLGMRCSRRELRELLVADQLAALDLLIWYRWQEYQQRAATIDPIGARGPFRYIKSATTPTRKRDELVRLHDVVASVWPDCRYRVTPDGRILIYEPQEQILTGRETP